jgi:hypothetical protein
MERIITKVRTGMGRQRGDEETGDEETREETGDRRQESEKERNG